MEVEKQIHTFEWDEAFGYVFGSSIAGQFQRFVNASKQRKLGKSSIDWNLPCGLRNDKKNSADDTQQYHCPGFKRFYNSVEIRECSYVFDYTTVTNRESCHIEHEKQNCHVNNWIVFFPYLRPRCFNDPYKSYEEIYPKDQQNSCLHKDCQYLLYFFTVLVIQAFMFLAWINTS